MNDKQIYELLHQQPRIRATEIAKVFNVELLVVSNALRTLVDVGDLVKHKEFDDQGRQSQVYELSDDFKKSREGKALASLPVTKAEVQKLPPAVVEQLSKPAQALVAAPGVRHGPKLTKAENCIAYIAQNGRATTDELREVLQLEHKGHVPTYLGTAVRKGQVHRDGDVWKLGPATPKKAENLEVVGNVIIATRDQTPVPAEVKAAVEEMAGQHPFFAPAPKPDCKIEVVGDVKVTGTISQTSPAPETKPMQSDPAPPARHRCAIWSDGTFEVETDGVRAASLDMDQAEALMSFIERMGGPRVAA